MPQSILMQKVVNFPSEFPVVTTESNTGETRALFKSEIRELGRSEYTEEEIAKYQVIHPIGNSFEGKGIIEDGSEHELIAISREETFNMFKTTDDYVLYTDSKKAIIEHGIKRLIKGTHYLNENRFEAEKISINLSDLKQEIQDGALGRIRGGWWRDLQIADVEVAYLGGGSVTDSDYWSTYEDSEGIISALRLDIPNTLDEDEDELLKVLLTKEGNLVVYKNIPSEKNLLEIAMTIFTLAKNHLE
jgi:hypothetical protein